MFARGILKNTAKKKGGGEIIFRSSLAKIDWKFNIRSLIKKKITFLKLIFH